MALVFCTCTFPYPASVLRMATKGWAVLFSSVFWFDDLALSLLPRYLNLFSHWRYFYVGSQKLIKFSYCVIDRGFFFLPHCGKRREKKVCAVKGMFCLFFFFLFLFFPGGEGVGGGGVGGVANSHVWEAKLNCNIMESVMRFLSVTLLYLFYHPFWHWCCLNNQFFDKRNIKKVWDCAIISARLASMVHPWSKL